MFGYEFANPEYFWLLLVIVPMIVWYVFKERSSHADLQFSSINYFKTLKRGSRIWLRHVLFALRVLAIAILVFALARPQSNNSWQTYNSEGIDIMLTMDVSTSMLARDFTPDRISAAIILQGWLDRRAGGTNFVVSNQFVPDSLSDKVTGKKRRRR